MSDLIERFNDNPLYRTLGIEIASLANGQAISVLEPVPEVCWPFEGQPHGGVLFTLMDTAMAIGVISEVGDQYSSATISLEIQYTARAQHPPFTCTSYTTHSTKNLSFARAEIKDNRGQTVAMGQGTFKLIDLRRRS